MVARILVLSVTLIALALSPAIGGELSPVELNNQAVALERAGDFAAADAMYQSAAAQSTDSAIHMNLWRNRVRGFLHDYGPIAQQVALVMLGIWLIKRVLSLVGRTRTSWREYRLYRRIRVSDCAVTVFDDQLHAEPDTRIYPDARLLRASVTLANAGVKEQTLCIAANLIAPDGSCARTLRQFIENRLPPPVTSIDFDFDELSGLLDAGGAWQIEVLLENNRKRLFRRGVWVVTRDEMLDDLSVEDVRLMVSDGDQNVASSVVPTTASAIVPTARLCVNTLRAEKFRNFNLRLELLRAGEEAAEMAQHVPLTFERGVAEFCDLSHPIAGSAMAQQSGEWQFKLFVDERWLATIDFVVRTPDELSRAVRAMLQVASTNSSGDVSLVGDAVFRFDAKTLVPMARLITPYRSPLIAYDVIFGAMADNEVIGHVQERVTIGDNPCNVAGGELDLSKSEMHGPVTFFLMVNGHCVAIRDVELKLSHVRHADIEGRLTAEAHKSAIDDDEAEQILADARVIV